MQNKLFLDNLSLFGTLKLRSIVFLKVIYYYLKRLFILHHLVQIYKLRNSCKNKSIFLFGNGPSVNKIDPHKVNHFIKNENFDFCAVNLFYQTSLAKIIEPNMYLLSDGMYLDTVDTNSNKIKSHIGLDHKHLNILKNKIRDLKNIIKNKKIKLFVPLGFKSKIQSELMGPQIYEFSDIQNIYSKNARNPILPFGFFTLSVYKALSICSWLGYKKIYIAGVDNNWFTTLHSNKSNSLFTSDSHFYEKDKNIEEKNLSESIRVPEINGLTTGQYLYNYSYIFLSLEKFNKKNIFNLDPDSLVNNFSKEIEIDVYK